MLIENLIKEWFEKWETGDFESLPISQDFRHTSPFGTIEGKEAYMQLIENNKDKFLGYQFEIIDTIFGKTSACVRYRGIQKDFGLDVSEWYYFENGLINEIVAYYHIGEIRENRQLNE